VPADEITHVFAPEFAEQARGVPMMYAALLNLVHLGAFEEAAVIAARIGAAQMFVIESPDGGKTLADMAGPGPNADGTESYGAGNGDLQLQAEPGARSRCRRATSSRRAGTRNIPTRRSSPSSRPACAASRPASASRTTTSRTTWRA
jgi:hypothetical protein